MPKLNASKTNVTARGKSDPRPKSELVVENFRKPNGAIGQRSHFVPINREPRE